MGLKSDSSKLSNDKAKSHYVYIYISHLREYFVPTLVTLLELEGDDYNKLYLSFNFKQNFILELPQSPELDKKKYRKLLNPCPINLKIKLISSLK